MKLSIGGVAHDSNPQYTLVRQFIEQPDAATRRFVNALREISRPYEFQVELELYQVQPVLRHRVSVTNLSAQNSFARAANLLPYALAAPDQTYNLFRVEQWAVAPQPSDFQPVAVPLKPDAAATTLLTGSGGAISAGQVFHASVAPADGHTDAIESYSPSSDSSVTMVVRDNTGASTDAIHLQGHTPDRTFVVHFQDDSRMLTLTGRRLAEDGVSVNLPEAQSGKSCTSIR